MPPEIQSKRKVNDGGELPGPGSKRSKQDTPHMERIVEVEGPGGCSTTVSETPPAPQDNSASDSTAIEPSEKRQKQEQSAGNSNKGGKQSTKDSSASYSKDEMVQEMNESNDSESAAGMGVPMEKNRDHQKSGKRDSRQKYKQEDFLKGQYGELGTPFEVIRQSELRRFKLIFEPIQDEVIEDSEDSGSEGWEE
ncbi:hypothetical protein KC323_g3303 [Hortaea werneckii]|nr:hypothetical protein KC323_g3303 [Hortaea werneckii]